MSAKSQCFCIDARLDIRERVRLISLKAASEMFLQPCIRRAYTFRQTDDDNQERLLCTVMPSQKETPNLHSYFSCLYRDISYNMGKNI